MTSPHGELLALLKQVLPGHGRLDGFCHRCFPDVHARFTAEMDWNERADLLLREVGVQNPRALLERLSVDLRWSFESAWGPHWGRSYPGLGPLFSPSVQPVAVAVRARRIFLSAEPWADRKLLNRLEKQLAPLEKRGTVELWDSEKGFVGADSRLELLRHLDEADLVVPLLSEDYLASEVGDLVLGRALSRRAQGRCEIAPVILRPCDWQNTPVAGLPSLPRDGRAVSQWSDIAAALLDVAQGIREYL